MSFVPIRVLLLVGEFFALFFFFKYTLPPPFLLHSQYLIPITGIQFPRAGYLGRLPDPAIVGIGTRCVCQVSRVWERVKGFRVHLPSPPYPS